jgi:hypothetical protein
VCSRCAGFSTTPSSWLQRTFVTLRRCTSDGCADRAQIALQMRQCKLRVVRNYRHEGQAWL